MNEGLLRYELQDSVAVLHLDDGRANAISNATVDALHGALDRAEKEARAALLLGRPGRFSAGFDLGTMREGPEAAGQLVRSGAELLARLSLAPLPIVAGCTGHALAMGALLLLAADYRVGAQGEFKIGLNEVAIRMTLPGFAVELSRERLSPRHFQRATSQAEIYSPDAAVDAGFLDHLVAPEELAESALREAARLAELPQRAYGETKRSGREQTVERMRRSLEP